MSSLRHLSFFSCHRLECFNEGIQRLTALRYLSFLFCDSLISLPQGMKHLTALEYLDITRCEKLNLMERDDYPTSLQTLHIGGLPQLVSLPQGLKGSADTLQFLCIFACVNLGVLPEWLPDLSSLRTLQILDCRKLSSLPEGMDRLTALRELRIVNCPELRRDYEREVGKDWLKSFMFLGDCSLRKGCSLCLKLPLSLNVKKIHDDVKATKKDIELAIKVAWCLTCVHLIDSVFLLENLRCHCNGFVAHDMNL
ncbi:putative disease resistance protein rga4 [Quercus suber]|uniref:Disease resistance protein rga4 n=1 Tax=Quercus suber TaxID=58331 RepID=A0AAW0L385_QUESU